MKIILSAFTDHIDDEYRWAGVEDPKLMVTTSHNPSSKLKQFAKVSNKIVLYFCIYRIMLHKTILLSSESNKIIKIINFTFVKVY